MFNAWKEKREDPKHGIDFPIPQSKLVADHILPFLPIFTPEDTAALQIKKTSWKNVKKFIKFLEKQLLLKSKDRNGGETVIMDVDFSDQAITNFVPYKLPKKHTGSTNDTAQSASSGDPSIGQQLKKLVLLRPREKYSPIFASGNANSHALYLPSELRAIITSYIESENLVSTTNKRLVNLNPILANAVFDSSTSLDAEVLAKGTVPREVLIERITHGCASSWAILRNDEKREDAKPRTGTAPSIKILLETRSGNKTVTKVSGVEPFYISPQPLADELQKVCASSTAVSQLVGSSPKNPVMEIMVQGPQKDIVIRALEKRGVRKEWVEVTDKTKGKKK